ncbi:MAG: chemotaxis protein CheB [Polyangiaceae bacterium]
MGCDRPLLLSARRRMMEQPFSLAAVVASAGGYEAFSTIARTLPASFPLAIALVIHRGDAHLAPLLELLQRKTCLHVKEAEQDEPLRKGWLYLAPGGSHLIVQPNERFGFSHGPKVNHARPAGDVLLSSAATVFGPRTIGVVLSGGLFDGAKGIADVKRHGGATLVQSPETALTPSMPLAAIASGAADWILPLAAMGPALVRLAMGCAVAPPG